MGVYDSGQQITLAAKFGTNLTELAASVAALATMVTVLDVTGYTAAGVILLDADTDSEEIKIIASVAGNVITLSTALAYGHADDTPVMLLADPTTVTLRLTNPLGVVTVYTYALAQIVRDALGRYHVLVTPTVTGVYTTRWEGTGTVVTAAEDSFTIRGTPPIVFHPPSRGYTTPDEVALELGVTFTSEQEAHCYQLIVEAEAIIDRKLGMSFTNDATQNVVETQVAYGGIIALRQRPLVSITSVAVASSPFGTPTVIAASQYALQSLQTGLLYVAGLDGWLITTTYVANSAFPADLTRAATLLVASWMRSSVWAAASGIDSDVQSYSVGGELTVTRFARTKEEAMASGVPSGVDRLLRNLLGAAGWFA